MRPDREKDLRFIRRLITLRDSSLSKNCLLSPPQMSPRLRPFQTNKESDMRSGYGPPRKHNARNGMGTYLQLAFSGVRLSVEFHLIMARCL